MWSFLDCNQSNHRYADTGTARTFGEDVSRSCKDEVSDPDFWRAVFAEFVGTCYFLIIGVGAALASDPIFQTTQPARLLAIASGFGIAITVMVYMYAHISGANFNPAVTLALVVAKRLTWVRGLLYIIAQTLGAVVGACTIYVIIPEDRVGNVGSVSPDPDITLTEAFLLEFIFTTILINVVFGSAVDTRALKAGTEHIGPAIGLCIFTLHLAGVSLTGCGINPARAFGTAVAANNFNAQWLYWLAPMLAGLFVGGTYPWIWGQGVCCGAVRDVVRGSELTTAGTVHTQLPEFGEKS